MYVRNKIIIEIWKYPWDTKLQSCLWVTNTHLFLLIGYGLYKPREAHAIARLIARYSRIVVQYNGQLIGGARLIQQAASKLLALTPQLHILRLALLLGKGQIAQLPRQLKGCQYGIAGGQANERRTAQRPIDIHTRKRVPQRVRAHETNTLVTAAAKRWQINGSLAIEANCLPYIMWHRHRSAPIQEYAQYFKVILVRRQHQRRYIGRKHGRIDVHLLPAL